MYKPAPYLVNTDHCKKLYNPITGDLLLYSSAHDAEYYRGNIRISIYIVINLFCILV